MCDQKLIELVLQQKKGIKSLRMTFPDIQANMELSENNVMRVLGKEIGFVYYRTGYQFEQYSGDADF